MSGASSGIESLTSALSNSSFGKKTIEMEIKFSLSTNLAEFSFLTEEKGTREDFAQINRLKEEKNGKESAISFIRSKIRDLEQKPSLESFDAYCLAAYWFKLAEFLQPTEERDPTEQEKTNYLSAVDRFHQIICSNSSKVKNWEPSLHWQIAAKFLRAKALIDIKDFDKAPNRFVEVWPLIEQTNNSEQFVTAYLALVPEGPIRTKQIDQIAAKNFEQLMFSQTSQPQIMQSQTIRPENIQDLVAVALTFGTFFGGSPAPRWSQTGETKTERKSERAEAKIIVDFNILDQQDRLFILRDGLVRMALEKEKSDAMAAVKLFEKALKVNKVEAREGIIMRIFDTGLPPEQKDYLMKFCSTLQPFPASYDNLDSKLPKKFGTKYQRVLLNSALKNKKPLQQEIALISHKIPTLTNLQDLHDYQNYLAALKNLDNRSDEFYNFSDAELEALSSFGNVAVPQSVAVETKAGAGAGSGSGSNISKKRPGAPLEGPSSKKIKTEESAPAEEKIEPADIETTTALFVSKLGELKAENAPKIAGQAARLIFEFIPEELRQHYINAIATAYGNQFDLVNKMQFGLDHLKQQAVHQSPSFQPG